MAVAAQLVDPKNIPISWDSIAGLDDVVTEIKETVILPIQKRHLFAGNSLIEPPKGKKTVPPGARFESSTTHGERKKAKFLPRSCGSV